MAAKKTFHDNPSIEASKLSHKNSFKPYQPNNPPNELTEKLWNRDSHMGIEEIIQRILSVRRNLTSEDVLKLIDNKKREAAGYFTDEGAARVVATELGVEVQGEPFYPEVLIRDLVSGLNDVTLTGRIIIVYPPRTFTRSDETEGKVAHLLIADESGELEVVLWDEKASLVEDGKLEQGQMVRVSHGYVREGLDGNLELHVGLRGSVEVSPSGALDRKFPPVTHFLRKIEEIAKGHKRVNMVGFVERVFPTSTFERRDGTQGMVRRLLLRDETGQISLALWNKKVGELGDVRKGDCLRVMDARVRENLDGQIEIHTKNGTQIETLTEIPVYLKSPRTWLTKINELKVNARDVRVLARVVHVGGIREFTRRNGKTGYVAALLLKDETGLVRLNLWEDKAALSESIQSGDVVLVEGAYTRERFGRINLNAGRQGVLTLNPEVAEAQNLPSLEEKTTKIADIQEEDGPITVEGELVTTPAIREVTTARGQRVAVASFELTDDTGEIRVSMWRRLVDVVKDLTIGTQVKIRNAYARRGLADQLELTSRMLTSIEILYKQGTTQSELFKEDA